MRGIVKKLISTIAAAALALAVMTLPAAPGSVAEAATSENCDGTHDGWTEWTSSTSLPTQTGKYFLTKDVTLSYAPSFASYSDITLCLNGHTVNGSNRDPILRIVYTFTLCDCQDSGKLTGASSMRGAVNIASGNFTMNGGTITGNTATDTEDGGGGVFVNDGTFTMNGGTISGNTSESNGGGVYFFRGRFIMNGGSITGNTAKNEGAGVMVVCTRGSFTINGEVKISGNTKTDDNSPSNVFLDTDKTITIGNDFITSSSIGIQALSTPTCKNPITLTSTTTTNISSSFTADTDGQIIVYSGSKVQLSGEHSAAKMEANAATCTKEGNIEYWKCSSCNKFFSDGACTNEITLAETVTEKAEHTYGEWQTTKDATCKAEGTKERSCTNGCGMKETDTIPKTTTHNFSDGICSVCSALDPDHTCTGGTATCSKKAVCTICNKEYGEPATHSYGAWTITKNPTLTATGTAQRTCVFGEKETKTDVPALSDSTVWTKDTAQHVEPTATTPGKDVYTSEAYGTVEVQIPALGGNSGSSSGGSSGSGSSESSTKNPPVAEVEVDENAPETEIATPDKDLKDAILSEEELADADDIEIILRVTDADPGADKQTIENRLASTDGFKVGQYIDISLFKVVNGNETKLTKTGKPIRVRFEIPEELRANGRTFAVIRVHDGKTALLADLDNDRNTVTIETDKFSTYALIYSDSPTASRNPATGAAAAIFPITFFAAAVMLLSMRRKN